jgi:hypothetical protein
MPAVRGHYRTDAARVCPQVEIERFDESQLSLNGHPIIPRGAVVAAARLPRPLAARTIEGSECIQTI